MSVRGLRGRQTAKPMAEPRDPAGRPGKGSGGGAPAAVEGGEQASAEEAGGEEEGDAGATGGEVEPARRCSMNRRS